MTLIADVYMKLQTGKDVVRQMSKQSPFRRLFNKGHGKRCQTLLKSEAHNLINSSLGKQLSWEKSLLVICKITELFLNRLTANEKCSLLKRDN